MNQPIGSTQSTIPVFNSLPVLSGVDYLQFVDDDIRKMYEGEHLMFHSWEPLMAQHVKEMRLWRKATGS